MQPTSQSRAGADARQAWVCTRAVTAVPDMLPDEREHAGPDGKPPASWPLERAPYYLETAVPGSFAAGDVRHRSIKRVATAAGEGAMAIAFVHRYLEETA